MKGKRGRPKKIKSAVLERMNLYAAGLDIGAKKHFVAVAPELDGEPVREFETFTTDLHAMAKWLKSINITTVAMESTGVYWIPIFELLEQYGFEVLLVNAKAVKNVSGRKTDVLDCQWIQQLHTYGLLKGAFRPAEQICQLRALLRQRETLIKISAMHIQHMQKALTQMNLLLHNVVTDITGTSGMAIIRAILNGERNPKKLAEHRHYQCKNSKDVIAKSLVGNYRSEHIFVLKQSVDLFDTYQNMIQSCDKEIEKLLQDFDDKGDPDKKTFSEGRKLRASDRNTPKYDLRTHLFRITGVDLTEVNGLNTVTILKVLSETGTDMSKWDSVKHFSSWLGLAPRNKISGGRILSGKTQKSANRAAQAFRMAAYALTNSQTALGAFLRRIRTRAGMPKAVTATAHKLARIFYTMLKMGKDFVDPGLQAYEAKHKKREEIYLKKRAALNGFQLVPIS